MNWTILSKRTLALWLLLWWSKSYPADLLQVYHDAFCFDPVFQEAIAQKFATQEGVPIALSSYLPNAFINVNPAIARYGFTGTSLVESFVNPRNNTQRTYNLSLNLSQTIFDLAQIYNIKSQIDISKAADATLNDAVQQLILRVATAYMNFLKDDANLKSTTETRQAYARQFTVVKAQHKRGIKSVTNIYTVEAAYQTSLSNELNAKRLLNNDKEALRRLTGHYYSSLKILAKDFKYIAPIPADVELWVSRSICQNWAIKAAWYTTESYRSIINQQFSGHLPTVSLQGYLSRQYINNINGYRSQNLPRGPGTISQRQVLLDINVPLISGGSVISLTNQAVYDYEAAYARLDQTIVDTLNQARTSFNNVMFLRQQVLNDKNAVAANQKAVKGMQVSYDVGVLSLVDLINQQLKFFQAQIQYHGNHYDYIINFVTLKKAAGTLFVEDLCALNAWLVYPSSVMTPHALVKRIKK